MTRAAGKLHYISKNENFNLMEAYHLRIEENQRLLDEITRLQAKLNDLNAELVNAQDEGKKYRELYLALRQGHYLLIPK